MWWCILKIELNFSVVLIISKYRHCGTPLGTLLLSFHLEDLVWNLIVFAFIKLSFPKNNTLQNVKNIRLLCILHKTLSRSSFKSAWVLKSVSLINQFKICVWNIFGDTQIDHVVTVVVRLMVNLILWRENIF